MKTLKGTFGRLRADWRIYGSVGTICHGKNFFTGIIPGMGGRGLCHPKLR
jgi:hypothetical protein